MKIVEVVQQVVPIRIAGAAWVLHADAGKRGDVRGRRRQQRDRRSQCVKADLRRGRAAAPIDANVAELERAASLEREPATVERR